MHFCRFSCFSLSPLCVLSDGCRRQIADDSSILHRSSVGGDKEKGNWDKNSLAKRLFYFVQARLASHFCKLREIIALVFLFGWQFDWRKRNFSIDWHIFSRSRHIVAKNDNGKWKTGKRQINSWIYYGIRGEIVKLCKWSRHQFPLERTISRDFHPSNRTTNDYDALNSSQQASEALLQGHKCFRAFSNYCRLSSCVDVLF